MLFEVQARLPKNERYGSDGPQLSCDNILLPIYFLHNKKFIAVKCRILFIKIYFITAAPQYLSLIHI